MTFLLVACALVGALPSADWAGRPFVTDPAPALTFTERDEPLDGGVDYDLAEQTARGGMLFSRFPEFRLRDRQIHLSGPWYGDAEANGHFRHGIETIEAMPNYRLEGAPTSVRALPPEHKWQLLCDPIFWSHAVALADELERANPADPRIAALRTFGVEHRMTADEAAFRELGRHVWLGEREPTDEGGRGVRYPSVDIEQTEGWEHQRDCFGWIYQGMARAAADNGEQIVPLTYGQWLFAVGAVWQSDLDPATGLPKYLNADQDNLAWPDPTLVACEQLGGIISMDGYMQAMWGSEPFYRRDAAGRLEMREGEPVVSDLDRTTLYGQEVSLEPGEARQCLENLYRQAVRMVILHHNLAGGYPDRSDQRKPFLERVKVGAWTRLTNEGLQGIVQNDRPLSPWLLETLMLMYLFTADDVVVWSSDMNVAAGPLGADTSAAWRFAAHGATEYLVKAAHRYSALDPIHEGQFRWCWFHLPMVGQNQIAGERYVEKPIVFGKLRPLAGRMWIELFASWPALDDSPMGLTLWVERDGRRSPEYRVRLANGRRCFVDAWRLPPELSDAEPRDVRLRFTDPLGQTHTWCGDWRVPVE